MGEGSGMFDDDETKLTVLAELGVSGSDDDPVRHHAYLILLAGNDIGQIFKIEPGDAVLGRSRGAQICLDDDSISRNHCRIRRKGELIEIEDLGSSNGTYVNGMRVSNLVLQDGDKIRVGDTTILKFTFHDELEESFQRHMYNAALRDGLTKAFNKRYCEDQLDKEIGYARRHGSALCVLFIDLDYFKKVNDHHGHVVGDDVLVQLAALIQSMLRSEDIFARWGGEEFAVITRGVSLANAGVLAERLRSAVDAAAFHSGEVEIAVTISIGVAAYEEHHKAVRDLVAAADSALYAAKFAGRNRVLLKELSQPPGAAAAKITGTDDDAVENNAAQKNVAEKNEAEKNLAEKNEESSA
jgi:diguanylate cyclase (GGDEF)-like protein